MDISIFLESIKIPLFAFGAIVLFIWLYNKSQKKKEGIKEKSPGAHNDYVRYLKLKAELNKLREEYNPKYQEFIKLHTELQNNQRPFQESPPATYP